MEWGTEHECLILDADHAVIFTKQYHWGEWYDDGEVLKEKWEPGMNVRAINYCIDEDEETFTSL